MICKQCGSEFVASRSRRFFCNHACSSASIRKFDLVKLKQLAERGELGKNMAADMGISPSRLHYVLLDYGLLEAWRKRRDQRYPKAGRRSAVGVCAPTIIAGLSAKSV